SVRFTVLHNNSRPIDGEPTHQIRLGHRAAVDLGDYRFSLNLVDLDAHAERVPHRRGAVIGDIQIEVPISVDIRQGHRHAARAGAETGLSRDFLEAAMSVVQEATGSAANRVDEQVQVAVAIDVGEYR